MNATKPGTLAGVQAPAESLESPEVTALVDRAKGGDAEAFAGLMHLYERRIIALGVQMGLSRDDALDVCQDAFIKVFRYIRRFQSGRSFFKWLYRIAIRTVYDQQRRQRQAATVSLDGLEGAPGHFLRDPAAGPHQHAESADLTRKLLAGLDHLSRQERTVFVLRDLQQMSTEEIGRIMRLSQITVRRHCMSARQKLRERISPRNP